MHNCQQLLSAGADGASDNAAKLTDELEQQLIRSKLESVKALLAI